MIGRTIKTWPLSSWSRSSGSSRRTRLSRGRAGLEPRHGIPLIFDEIVTGFRFAYGGAQEYYGVVPDVVALGKVVGGGFPLSAVAGRRDIMRHLAPDLDGTPEFVAQAGTLNGNPIAAAAGLARWPSSGSPGMRASSRRVPGSRRARGRGARAGLAAQVAGEPPVFEIFFTDRPITDYRATSPPTRPSRRVHAGDARARRGQGRAASSTCPRAWRGRCQRTIESSPRRSRRPRNRHPNRRGGLPMAEHWKNAAWAKDILV